MARSARARTALLWTVAFVVTVVFAGYQRRTGPTWPVTVDAVTGGAVVHGSLPRSHPGPGGPVIELRAAAPLAGHVAWRRWPTNDAWTDLPMGRRGADRIAAELPHFPPAAKVEYAVRVGAGDDAVTLPPTGPVVLRYRGDVPAWVIVPHILCMFAGLLVGVRAAIGAATGERRPERLVAPLLLFLVPGGLLLGPIVQKFAFDAYWTGWPVGEDLTDTKTLAIVAGWVAAWAVARTRPGWSRAAVLAAAALMIAVYLVPHSVRGSQLDWSKVAPAARAEGVFGPGAPASRE